MALLEVFYEGNLSTRCIDKGSGAEIMTDAPIDSQGRGLMFSPTDLLAASLGSCVLTLMGIAAQKLQVDLTGTRAFVEKQMVLRPVRRIGKLIVSVRCPQIYHQEIQTQIESAGKLCPVHHSLHPEIIQEFDFRWGVS